MSNFWGAYQLISVSTRKYKSEYDVLTETSTTHIDLGGYRNGLNILSLYQLKIYV